MYRRFCIGVDRSKMKLYDVDDAEKDLVDDTPVFDKSKIGAQLKNITV
jgi:hypothetical protein